MPDLSTLATGTWLPIDQLSEQLLCSERTIDTLRADGVFIPGTHFYAVGNGKQRGKFIYSLEGCRAALLQRTADHAHQRVAAVDAATTYDEGHLDELLKRVRHD